MVVFFPGRRSVRNPATCGGMSRGGWHPILRGELGRLAIGRARSIGESLRASAGSAGGDSSLAGGEAGKALLFGYLARMPDGGCFQALVEGWLDRAANESAAVADDPSLFSGYPGVAFTASHLGRMRGSDGIDRRFESDSAIDDKVARLLGRSRWPGSYDLVDGLVGIGVLALERMPRRPAAEALSRVVDHLSRLAVRTEAGLTWHTPPRLLPAIQRESCPGGHYNAGVAHGVPGVIALLGRVLAAGVAVADARRLLAGAVEWLLAVGRGEGHSRFPFWHVPGEEPGDCRAAWCYGDPGVASALLLAGRCAGVRAWEREAVATALRAAARAPQTCGIRDAGFCHGAAGLGHVFNRLYRETLRPEFRRAATYWLMRALEMSAPEALEAGGKTVAKGAGLDGGDDDDRSVLTGTAGIGLTLLAAATSVEPGWDRMFLLSTVRPT